jgi:hypothetical protein
VSCQNELFVSKSETCKQQWLSVLKHVGNVTETSGINDMIQLMIFDGSYSVSSSTNSKRDMPSFWISKSDFVCIPVQKLHNSI